MGDTVTFDGKEYEALTNISGFNESQAAIVAVRGAARFVRQVEGGR